MANQDFNIVMRVVGGQVAAAEVRGVAGAEAAVGEAQLAAGKKARTAAGGFIKQALAIGAVYKAYTFLKSSVDTTETLAKSTLAVQRATGLDTKTAQAWVVATQSRGITTKNFQMAMATLAKNIDTVGSKSSKAATPLAKLGISQKALAAAGPQQRLNMLSNAFEKMPASMDKARVAQQLFGRSGQQLLPMLNLGAKGMGEQLNQAKKLVPSIGKNSKAIQEDIAAQRKYQEAILGVKVALGTALIPILTAVTSAVTPITTAFAGLMKSSTLFRGIIYALVAAFAALLLPMIPVVGEFFALEVALLGIELPIAAVIAVIAALAVGLIYAYKHVTWFHNAVNAVANFLRNNWKLAVTIAATVLLGPFVGALVLIVTHFRTFKAVAGAVISWVKGAFNGLVGFLSSIPGRIAKLGRGAFNGFKQGAEDAKQWIVNAFNNAWHFLQSFVAFVASIPGKIKNVFTSIPGKIAHKFGFAEGGPVMSTGSYLVGEQGPEVVTLSRGQTVIPNEALGGVAGGATIHTHVILDRKEIALAVGRYTSDQQKRR